MNYTILVIDDNQMMRAFLSHLFDKQNEVVIKNSAEEALVWLNGKNRPDIIITDYELEGMSGFELLKKLKDSDTYRHMPVVILSGKGRSDYRTECLQAGAADFVVKPFNPADLEQNIMQIIQSSRLQTDNNPD